MASPEGAVGKTIRTLITLVGIGGLGYLGLLGARSLIDQNAAQQLKLLYEQATLQASGLNIAPGSTMPSTETIVANTSTPFPTQANTPTPESIATLAALGLPELNKIEWPQTAKDFLAAIQVPEDQIPAEYKADPYYRPLQEGMITKEYDQKGNWTGGWQIFVERNAGDNDQFPFVMIRNSGQTMQYGYMHDKNLRDLAGFTAEEVARLGIGENHIGAGIPVTGNASVAVEGLTFYPMVNKIDGSNNVHFLYAQLGADMQTMEARLNRSATSSIFEGVNSLGNITVMVNGSPVNFDGDNNAIYKVNRSHALGGAKPKRTTSFSNLSAHAQAFQRNPFKGIKGV